MPGEPVGVFDVNTLEVIEMVSGVETSSHIVDVGENFNVRAEITADGTDPAWKSWRDINDALGPGNEMYFVRAHFYAEGMGPGVLNQTFGTTDEPINADNFTVDSPLDNIGNDGIYRCGVMVNVYFKFGVVEVPMKAWLGFNEECPLQVNEHET
jgi:hypothetical protein